MPLRLARYGVPLAETASAGPAAAGIDEPPIQFTFGRAEGVAQRQSSDFEAAVVEQEQGPVEVGGAKPAPLGETRAAHLGQTHGLGDDEASAPIPGRRSPGLGGRLRIRAHERAVRSSAPGPLRHQRGQALTREPDQGRFDGGKTSTTLAPPQVIRDAGGWRA